MEDYQCVEDILYHYSLEMGTKLMKLLTLGVALTSRTIWCNHGVSEGKTKAYTLVEGASTDNVCVRMCVSVGEMLNGASESIGRMDVILPRVPKDEEVQLWWLLGFYCFSSFILILQLMLLPAALLFPSPRRYIPLSRLGTDASSWHSQERFHVFATWTKKIIHEKSTANLL